jgi:hypothetical protein
MPAAAFATEALRTDVESLPEGADELFPARSQADGKRLAKSG